MFQTSCSILIELVALNSEELFTKCKNSKYFSRYCEKCKRDLDVFDPPLGIKRLFLGYFIAVKAKIRGLRH